MTRYGLRFTEEVDAQVDAADAWWRENRPAAVTVFSDELHAVTELITRMPGIGAPYSTRTTWCEPTSLWSWPSGAHGVATVPLWSPPCPDESLGA